MNSPAISPASPNPPAFAQPERQPDGAQVSELTLAEDKPTLWGDLQQLTKARLTTFVLLTTAVGYGLALSPAQPFDWLRFFHTILGTALVAGCSSVLNQYLERQSDALMVRTASRPFVTKRLPLGTTVIASLFAGVLGTWELDVFVNPLTALLGVITLASYVLLYTPLKRFTELNTLVGAIPGALPPLMGASASSGSCPAIGWSLFAIMLIWQLPHFYAIAFLYRDDYNRGGMRMISTHDESGSRTSRHALFWATFLFPISLLPLLYGRVSPAFYAPLAVALDLFFIYCAIAFYRQPERSSARTLFFSSIIWLPLLLTALVVTSL